jgi:hypothetical protein
MSYLATNSNIYTQSRVFQFPRLHQTEGDQIFRRQKEEEVTRLEKRKFCQ